MILEKSRPTLGHVGLLQWAYVQAQIIPGHGCLLMDLQIQG